MRNCTIVLPLSAALIVASLISAGGTVRAANVLENESFESPVVTNVKTNNLGVVPTGWSQTGASATWNLIRLDGTAYGDGPDNAADGAQIVDLNGVFTLFQSFTLTEPSNLSFGASFSNRGGHDGTAASTVGIYDSAGTTLLSNLVTVDTSADPTPSVAWSPGQDTMSNVSAGTYQFRIALNNFNNADATFVDVTPVPEPSTLLLAALGLLGLAFYARRRR